MNPLSLITLITGVPFVVIGLIFKFFPPKNINSLYGYRTASSMRNLETWQLANQFAAKLMIQMGGLLMAVGVLTFLLPPSPVTGLVAGIALVIISVVMQVYFTEKHINKHFDGRGNWRK
jgi:uncharacterized membrane protein